MLGFCMGGGKATNQAMRAYLA